MESEGGAYISVFTCVRRQCLLENTPKLKKKTVTVVTFQENLWVVEGLGIGMKSRRSPSNLQAMGMLVGLGGHTHLEGSMNLNGTGFRPNNGF